MNQTALLLLAIAYLVGLIALFFSMSSRTQPQTWRLARIERKLDRIMSHLGIADDADDADAHDPVRELLLQGRKIDAIKAYRERTGAGLKDARDAVDEMERQLLVR